MQKIKFVLIVVVIMSAVVVSSATVNGVNIYEEGHFPVGKTIQVSDLNSVAYGKQKVNIYLETPLKFKNNGIPNSKGGFTYTAKINHTWVGNVVSGFTSPEITSAVFILTIPYKTPFRKGDAYVFGAGRGSPITIINKSKQIGSNGKNFDLYKCIYEGYVNFEDVKYPAYIPKDIIGK